MKKFICVLIILLILVSCGGNAVENNTKKDESTAAIDTTAEELRDNVPAMTFGGEIINILENDRSNQNMVKSQIFSTGENGDLINDAIYRRNINIEDRFDIKLNVTLSTSAGTAVQRAVLADDDTYDLVNERIQDIKGVLSKNMLINLKTLPYVDFSMPWWDQRATKDFSIANKLFINISASDLTATQHTWLVSFNKVLMDDVQMEYPYQLVRDGKWTIDKFYSMIMEINPRDLDGDGIMNEKDFWGLGNEYYNTCVMLSGAGERMFRKDADDIPFVSMNTARAVDVLDKVFDIVLNKNITLTAQHYTKYTNSYYEVIYPAYMEDRMLFYMTGMHAITDFRDMASDFGIVPIPKFDELQDDYYNTMTIYGVMVQGVPITISNDKFEMMGAFLEVLACESYKTVVPAYYEVTLKNKILRDDESVEMLDIISKTRIFDLGYIYNWGGALDLYQTLTGKNSRDFVSEYMKIEARIITAMEKDIESIIGE
ncbi:MAG: hypothetical protein FWF15_01075 [Oscillospiraceae bacterium]|nr:hypothetical protein [Oscillospiraceae bacterium]